MGNILKFLVIFVKGTWKRDYNGLKVIWLDRPELVLAPDIMYA